MKSEYGDIKLNTKDYIAWDNIEIETSALPFKEHIFNSSIEDDITILDAFVIFKVSIHKFTPFLFVFFSLFRYPFRLCAFRPFLSYQKYMTSIVNIYFTDTCEKIILYCER